MKQCNKCGGFRYTTISKEYQCTCVFNVYKPEIKEISYKSFTWSISQIPEEFQGMFDVPSEEEYNKLTKAKGSPLSWRDILRK